MNADWLFALSPLVIALAAVGVIVPVYVRLGRLEGEVTSNRERSNEQFRQAREWSDEQFIEARERPDTQYAALRERFEVEFRQHRERTDLQFAQLRERSDSQHAEVLAEIRRLTDAFLSHSHAPDGGIIFRVPPPSGSTLSE